MRFPSFPFAVLDTETTGFLPRVHHIAELACVRCEGGKEVATFEQLTNPPDELPPHVQVLTRITPAMLEGKPRIVEVADEFLKTLGTDTLLVGQNLQFDLGMLKGEGIDLTERLWIDTSLLAALAFPELKSFSLQYISNALDLPHEPQHRALGDVRATTALLGAIWERLCELPAEHLAEAKRLMSKSSPGYAQFFDALPAAGGKGKWLQKAIDDDTTTAATPLKLPVSKPGEVTLMEEPLDAEFIPSVIAGAVKENVKTWIAVKNLDSALKRHDLPTGVAVIYPPSLLLNPEAAKQLALQDTLLPEEATLALKLSWFTPRVRADLALHAGERDMWNGKLAATEEHPTYLAQLKSDAPVHLIDHRQLFSFLATGDVIKPGDRIVVDDASMLEDTATKAFGVEMRLDDLRAAAQGHALLTQLADRTALWAETVKAGTDQRMLTAADFSKRETQGLASLLDDALQEETLPSRVKYLLSELQSFLHPPTDIPMLSWIETRAQSGSVSVHAAPERIDLLLKKLLFEPLATTLLVPAGLKGALPVVVPDTFPRTLHTADTEALHNFPVSFPDETMETFLQNPPPGKSIALVGSKRLIEQAFIRHTERLEAQGVTLICQGMSGGQGRMESDFLASEGTTIWMLTPWTYEGIDVPERIVDHLILDSLPFDHPGQPVFSRRKDLFQNGFEQYALVRLLQRLFRLLRAFERHRTPSAEVRILDQRMKEKSYANRVREYLGTFASETPVFAKKKIGETAAPKKKKPKTDGPQQALPL